MDSLFTKSHALIIGIGTDDIPITAKDAEKIGEILSDPSRCMYPPNQVKVLTKVQATKPAIIAALSELKYEADEDATILFYYSGHGAEIDNAAGGKDYFLLPHDTDKGNIRATGLSGKLLTGLLSDIPCRKMLILLDCCHAGGLGVTKGEFDPTPIPIDSQKLLAGGKGRAIIASCKAGEKSLILKEKDFSIFTLAVIESLSGLDTEKQDGLVRIRDISKRADSRVPFLSKQAQNPTFDWLESDNFPVAYYAGTGIITKGLPDGVPKVDSPEEVKPLGQTTINNITHNTTTINTSGGNYFGKVGGKVNIGGSGSGDNFQDVNAGNIITGATFNGPVHFGPVNTQNETTKKQETPTPKGTKEEIQDLIGKDKIAEAIDSFILWAKVHKDRQLENDLILQKGRLSSVRSKVTKNVITSDEENREYARIRAAVLDLWDNQ